MHRKFVSQKNFSPDSETLNARNKISQKGWQRDRQKIFRTNQLKRLAESLSQTKKKSVTDKKSCPNNPYFVDNLVQ